MTEQKIREKIVSTAMSYLGMKEGSSEHRALIDLYNSMKPLPRGYQVTYRDSWCAVFVSVIAHLAGVESVVGRECGCEEFIKIFKKRGIWVEDGTITPEIGDIILYNWDDKTQPNNGYADHIGYVAEVNRATGIIKAVEGNYQNQVKRRNIAIGYGCIRGYARPNYAALAETKAEAEKQDYENLGWNWDGKGWWYAYGHNRGEYHVNNAWRIDGKLYFFDRQGYCVLNPHVVTDGKGALQYIEGERVRKN